MDETPLPLYRDPDWLALQLKLSKPLVKTRIFCSAGSVSDKERLLPSIRALAATNVEIYATAGTSAFLERNGVPTTLVEKIHEGKAETVKSLLRRGRFDLVVNIMTGDAGYDEQSDARTIRNIALADGIPLITDVEIAAASIVALASRIAQLRVPHTYRSMREVFAEKVHARGGYADNHGHYDKAYLIQRPELTGVGQIPMREKWLLYRKLKEDYTFDDLCERIRRCVEFRLSCGVTHMRTMVDADTLVELKCIDAALAVKRDFAGTAIIEIGIQPLEGVVDPGARKWVQKACEMADFIGGLPSKDAPNPEEHLAFILAMGRDMHKRVDVHVDQQGTPEEDETRLLARMTMQFEMEGRVSGIHSIVSRKPLYLQEEIAKMTADAGIIIQVCPGAALSMEQRDMQGQVNNCIAPVPLYRTSGTRVVLGSDNTEDPFMPVSDGDPWYEAHLLMDACREYNLDTIADIACDKSLFATIA